MKFADIMYRGKLRYLIELDNSEIKWIEEIKQELNYIFSITKIK